MATALCHLVALGVLVVAVASVAASGDPQRTGADEKTDIGQAMDQATEFCGPNGDIIGCVLGAVLGDTQLARGYHRFGKKMILPLLVGILLKVASFVPLILGKLSLLALVSIVASKLALIISAFVGTKKLYSGSGGYSHPGHDWDWEHAGSEQHLAYADYPAVAAQQAQAAYAHAHRRVAPGLGRSLHGDADRWTPFRGFTKTGGDKDVPIRQQQEAGPGTEFAAATQSTQATVPPHTPIARRRRQLSPAMEAARSQPLPVF